MLNKVDKFVLWIMLLITFLIMGLAITGCNNNNDDYLNTRVIIRDLLITNPIPLSEPIQIGMISITYDIDSTKILNTGNRRYDKTLVTYVSNIKVSKEIIPGIVPDNYISISNQYFEYRDEKYYVLTDIQNFIKKHNENRFHKNHLFVWN